MNGTNPTERYDVLVVGSGEARKYLAWTLAEGGQRTAMIERKLVGGLCPNIACLPSKNVIHSAKVAALAKRAHEFGLDAGTPKSNMKVVRAGKQTMVDDLVKVHLGRYEASGTELIMGDARFIAPHTVDVALNDGGHQKVMREDHSKRRNACRDPRPAEYGSR